MNQVNNKEAYRLLHEEGFSDLEIPQIIQLRRDYIASKQVQTELKHPHLQFFWWFAKTMFTHDIGYAWSHRPLMKRPEA